MLFFKHSFSERIAAHIVVPHNRSYECIMAVFLSFLLTLSSLAVSHLHVAKFRALCDRNDCSKTVGYDADIVSTRSS